MIALSWGALGCGVFKNPPEKVAQLFQEALMTYQRYFQEIVFAVLDCGTGNFKIFERLAPLVTPEEMDLL